MNFFFIFSFFDVGKIVPHSYFGININLYPLPGDKETIEVESKIYGGKGANLRFLKRIESSSFQVPYFSCIRDFSSRSIDDKIHSFPSSMVSVRSSGQNEDSSEESLAGFFTTELNVSLAEVNNSIQRIHKHSLEKGGEKIPLVVQEMIDCDYSGVVFTYDILSEKPYFVINIGKGLGDSIVSGTQSGETYKIFSEANDGDIPNEKMRSLFQAVKEIAQKYPTPYIDIEFGFKEGEKTPYIFQVRPIVFPKKTTPYFGEKSLQLGKKYAKRVSLFLEKTGEIYGNMIDINPQELVGNQPPIIQSFFKYIFPDSSLNSARESLGYRKATSNIMNCVQNYPYISLDKNIDMFLPAKLNQRVVESFRSYFRDFTLQFPHLQSHLDSVYFPNTQLRFEEILSKLPLSEKEKEESQKIGKEFFKQLEEKLFMFESTLEQKLKEVFKQLSMIINKNILGIEDLTIMTSSVNTEDMHILMSLIKDVTYLFVIAARGAFYFHNKDSFIDQEIFRAEKYERYIYEFLRRRGVDKVPFVSVEGFNFLKKIDSEYREDQLREITPAYETRPLSSTNPTTRFMVYRENIKYVFSRFFLVLHNSIIEKEKVLHYRDFENFLTSFSPSQGEIQKKVSRFQAEVTDILLFPPVMHRNNNMLFMKVSGEEGQFIGKGKIIGKVLSVDSVSEITKENAQDTILLIENATPEIDIFLPFFKAIITKNGGPLSHIAIRAREYNIPVVVGVGDVFYSYRERKELTIDFQEKNIS